MAKLRIQRDLWMEIIRALSLKMELGKVTIGVVLAVMETCVIPSTLSKCHIAKYKTLEEKQNLVLTSPEGEKRWPLPFQKPKNWAAEKRTSSKRWGSGTKQQLQEKLTEFLGGTTRVPELLYGESQLSWGEINLNQYEVLFFEPLHCYLNHISCVRGTPSSHHRCGHTCDIEGDTLYCPQKRQVPLQQLFSSTSPGHHSLKWKIRQQCNGLLTTLAEKVGIFYAKDDTRYPKQILRLANLSFNRGCSL